MNVLFIGIGMRYKMVYFAHAMAEYYTLEEETALKAIYKHFPDYLVINPRDFHFSRMHDYLELVKNCAAVVFKRCLGFITAGVWLEINFAKKWEIPVFEVTRDSIVPYDFLGEIPLNRKETNNLFKAIMRARCLS
ncbi:MAG: hypothetical protein DRO67_07270 [Candidatus Asgardarchaeum californiense]|nr:MAG: hypothetical protein DRO67_07270 [Candidatus Asgardarchaeum californiense]